MSAPAARALTAADRAAARSLWQARFHDAEAFAAWYFAERFDPALSAGVFDGGTLLSMALGRRVRLGGAAGGLPAVLVAGVSTREGYERRGFMRRAMAQLEAQAVSAGAALLVLRPVDQAIYLPLGFSPYSAACLAPASGGAPQELRPAAQADAAALAACYAAATERLDAALSRTEADMAARLAEVASDGGLCVALSDGGAVQAYALLDAQAGDAVEAAARSPELYAALLDALPAGCLAQLPPDAPRGARIPHLMAKALSAQAAFDPALAAARFIPEEY